MNAPVFKTEEQALLAVLYLKGEEMLEKQIVTEISVKSVIDAKFDHFFQDLMD